jgi:hypothetical protein
MLLTNSAVPRENKRCFFICECWPSDRKGCSGLKDAVQSDLRMCTKEPSFYLQTVYLGFYFILCSCKAGPRNVYFTIVQREGNASRINVMNKMFHKKYCLCLTSTTRGRNFNWIFECNMVLKKLTVFFLSRDR